VRLSGPIAPSRAGRPLGPAWWLAGALIGVACSAENGRGVVMGSLNVPECTFPDRKATPLKIVSGSSSPSVVVVNTGSAFAGM